MRTYARIVYAGLKFYETNLATEKEESDFKAYKVEEIPSKTSIAIADIIAAVDLESAYMRIRTKSEETRTQILNVLWKTINKVAWTTQEIGKINAKAILGMVKDAENYLSQRLESTYKAYEAVAGSENDPIICRQKYDAITTWKITINNSIDALAHGKVELDIENPMNRSMLETT